MPISKEEFNNILEAIKTDSCDAAEMCGDAEVINSSLVMDILEKYIADPNSSTGRNPKFVTNAPEQLTVERVKGMIEKLRDAGLSREECENCKDCPVCRTDAPRAYKFALDELSNEIYEAENDRNNGI